MDDYSNVDKKMNSKTYVLVGMHGFFVSETDEIGIDKPDDLEYIAESLKRNYTNASPFGFRRFYKRDGKKHFIDEGWIYIDGKVKTKEEVLVQNDVNDDHEILASNMKNNNIDAVIMFDNGKAYPFDMKTDMLLGN